MIERANWFDFDKKNKDRTKAFEDMCRILFLRDRKKSAYDYSYNINEAGLEFQPVFDEKENKWYGAQCKYFITESNTKKYTEIYESIKKAIKYFKDKLDVIYIYTNAELKHSCTDEEINSDSKAARINLARVPRENDINIIWLQADNILDEIKEPSNLDLYKMYFSDSREIEFINDIISIEENTFLQSNQFMNLRFKNGDTLESLASSILGSKYGLILGAAGTGKSVGMKKLYKEFYDRFNMFYFGKKKEEDSICIPVFIRLRECVNGNLEDLIRERFKDYNLNHTSDISNYIYLLDGLDEVPYHDVSKVIHFIKHLASKKEVHGIVVSSRNDSNNLSYFRQEFSWEEYSFNKLNCDDIRKYFELKKDQNKIERLKSIEGGKLLDEIDDIFSVNLLWENIEKVDFSTSKIEIIELTIVYWIGKYSKLNDVPLLEPKQEKICCICQEISLLMQENLTYSISLDEVQKLIKQQFEIVSPKEINTILEALTELFFELSNHGGLELKMVFRHKRFQEFFLYQKIEKEYYNRPSILRELRLLSNRDFMVNIFLRTSLSRAQASKDMYKFLALRLLENYLGDWYIKEDKDNLIGKSKLYSYTEPLYSYSKAFLYLLSTYDVKELDVLIDNENLKIKDCITKDNFAEFVEIYHRINGKDISHFLNQKFKLEKIEINYKNIDKLYYYSYNIKNKKINEIDGNILSKSLLNHDDVKHMDYVAHHDLKHSVIKLALEFELEYLTDTIDNMDKYMLEVLCYNLAKYRYVNILLDDKKEFQNFREKLISRVEKEDEQYYINTLAIYAFLSKEEKYDDKLSSALEEVNIGNFPTWIRHIELHILLAILKKDKNRYQLNEIALGVEIVKIMYENYKNKNEILKKWMEAIKPYNFIYSNFLKYYHSYILGVLISKIKFDVLEVKSFLRELLNYENVIYIQTVLFTIYKYNKDLFEKVVNKGLLDKVLQGTAKNNIDEYDSLSESMFQLAVMYNSIDIDKKYELFITGIDNSIVRPAYREEDLASRVLPECLYLAHESYWYDKYNMESKCHRLYDILDTINKTTDNATTMGSLKWVVEHCGIDNKNLERNLYDCTPYPLYNEKEIFDYDMELISIDNIEEYYCCNVKDVPYDSIQFWRDLIEIEYKIDNNLPKLYDVFKKNNYPSYFGSGFIQYWHIPTVILLENDETRENIVKFIFEQGGVYGMYNMIRVFFIIGDMQNGINYIEHLFKFCDLLIGKSKIIIDEQKPVYDKNHPSNIDKYIRGSWITDEYENEAISTLNPNVKISWSDYEEKEEYKEEWATCHPDQSAYRYDYKFFVEGTLIRRFSLVWIDGFRAVLPIPKIGTNVVKRDDYLLSRIFNHSIRELNSYMRSSGLIVE